MKTEETKLINTIADRIKTEREKHPFIDWEIFAAQKIYDTLITFWQEKTRWIPVDEKLPPRGSETRQVFVKNENKHSLNWMIVSCFDEDYFDDIEFIKREFTHWKEIE